MAAAVGLEGQAPQIHQPYQCLGTVACIASIIITALGLFLHFYQGTAISKEAMWGIVAGGVVTLCAGIWAHFYIQVQEQAPVPRPQPAPPARQAIIAPRFPAEGSNAAHIRACQVAFDAYARGEKDSKALEGLLRAHGVSILPLQLARKCAAAQMSPERVFTFVSLILEHTRSLPVLVDHVPFLLKMATDCAHLEGFAALSARLCTLIQRHVGPSTDFFPFLPLLHKLNSPFLGEALRKPGMVAQVIQDYLKNAELSPLLPNFLALVPLLFQETLHTPKDGMGDDQALLKDEATTVQVVTLLVDNGAHPSRIGPFLPLLSSNEANRGLIGRILPLLTANESRFVRKALLASQGSLLLTQLLLTHNPPPLPGGMHQWYIPLEEICKTHNSALISVYLAAGVNVRPEHLKALVEENIRMKKPQLSRDEEACINLLLPHLSHRDIEKAFEGRQDIFAYLMHQKIKALKNGH